MMKVDDALYPISLILGGTGAWIINRWGYIFGLVDKPNDRSSHDSPTAKGGGIGILAAFVFSSLFLEELLVFWLPATVLALFSLLGDRIDISPKIRLPLQFIAAMIFVLLSAFSLQLSVSSFLFLSLLLPIGIILWMGLMVSRQLQE